MTDAPEREIAYQTYINEVTPNGNTRLDNIILCNAGDSAEQHIATQIDIAFQAGWSARAEAAEANLAHLENHIESVAKDTHKIMVAYYEAALPAVYRLGLEAAARRVEARAAANPFSAGQYANSAFDIRRLPTPTAAELMAGINKGEKE